MAASNANFDFEEYLYSVLAENTLYESHALWLDGFRKIFEDCILDNEKLSNYTRFSFQNNSFDRTLNPNFYKGHVNLIEKQILNSYFLRIDEDYHLAFWTIPITRKKDGEVFYDDDYCKLNFHVPYEKGITTEKYPSIDLRLNNHIQSDKHPDFIEFNGELYNRYNAFRKSTSFEVLLKSYDSMQALKDYSAKGFTLDNL